MQPFQRRSFLSHVAAASAIPFIPSFLKPESDFSWIDQYKSSSTSSLVEDEKFWYQVKNMYTCSPALLNLNNGGVSPQPIIVQEAFERYNRLCNEAPSYYMWRILDQGREPLRQKGCVSERVTVVECCDNTIAQDHVVNRRNARAFQRRQQAAIFWRQAGANIFADAVDGSVA